MVFDFFINVCWVDFVELLIIVGELLVWLFFVDLLWCYDIVLIIDGVVVVVFVVDNCV